MAGASVILKWAMGLGLVGAAIAAAVSLARAARASNQVGALRAEVSQLRRAPRTPPQLVVHKISAADESKPETPVSAQPAVPADEDNELSDDEREHRLTVINETRAELCDKRYAEEGADPDWSRQAEAAIRAAFSGEGFESVQLSINCRSTLCRMDFIYPRTSLLSPEVRHQLVATQPWPGQRFSIMDTIRGDGSSYFSRSGFDLPQVDPSTLNY